MESICYVQFGSDKMKKQLRHGITAITNNIIILGGVRCIFDLSVHFILFLFFVFGCFVFVIVENEFYRWHCFSFPFSSFLFFFLHTNDCDWTNIDTNEIITESTLISVDGLNQIPSSNGLLVTFFFSFLFYFSISFSIFPVPLIFVLSRLT